ncbi:MAG: DNA repair protein RecO [Acidobacteriota bacterium]
MSAATTLHTSDAFVLRTYPYGEAHKVVVLFTRSSGLARAVAHGAQSRRQKYGAALELFSEVYVVYRERPGQDLVSLVTCDVKRLHFAVAADPVVMAMLSYWAELTSELFPPYQPNNAVYRLLAAGCELAERYVQAPLAIPDALMAYVETWLLRLAGFLPDWKHCTRCGVDLLSTPAARLATDGTPGCVSCLAHGQDVSLLARRAYAAIQRQSPGEFWHQAPDANTLAELFALNGQLVCLALERSPRSRVIWQQLRAGSNL